MSGSPRNQDQVAGTHRVACCGAHDRVDGLHGHASGRSKACQTGRARPRAAIAAACLPERG